MASASLIFVATAARVAPGNGVAAAIAIQNNHCDPYLPVSKDAVFGYRARGDRCEGVYIQPVSSTPLVVASFGRFPRPDSYQPTGSVLVEWTPDTGDVRLRTMSLKPRMYYRMDSRQRASAGSFAWRTNVLAALRLTGSDIGLVAWTRRTLGGAARNVYLPVRMGAPASGERDTTSSSRYRAASSPRCSSGSRRSRRMARNGTCSGNRSRWGAASIRPDDR